MIMTGAIPTGWKLRDSNVHYLKRMAGILPTEGCMGYGSNNQLWITSRDQYQAFEKQSHTGNNFTIQPQGRVLYFLWTG